MLDLIAKRAALALENARLYNEAQEANRLKDEFLATLSHELRTPLNAILGWAHMLATGNLDAATTHKAVQAVYRNARVQGQLVADVLDVSRIITGKLRLNITRVRVSAALERAVESVHAAAEAKGLRLNVIVGLLAIPMVLTTWGSGRDRPADERGQRSRRPSEWRRRSYTRAGAEVVAARL
jgi:signal transduction histidine kinase